MPLDGSVTQWISRVKIEDNASANLLFERYFERLSTFARPRMNRHQRPLASEEDVAQSVLNLFCQGIRRGSFAYIKNRNELWRLLARVATRKIIDYQRRFRRRRVRLKEVRESEIVNGRKYDRSATRLPSIDQLLANDEFEPQMLVTMQEEYRRLLTRLNRPTRRVADLLIQGFSAVEIAARVDMSRRSVERKIRLIRDLWEESLG